MKQLFVWFVGYLVGSTLVGAADTIITGGFLEYSWQWWIVAAMQVLVGWKLGNDLVKARGGGK